MPDTDVDDDLMSVEAYAVKLVAEGAESLAEDDMNENGEVDEADHEDSMDLAIDLAHAIRDHPDAFLAWARPHLPERSLAILAAPVETVEAVCADLARSGHGHVVKRSDGVLARCGGPALCRKCAADADRLAAATRTA